MSGFVKAKRRPPAGTEREAAIAHQAHETAAAVIAGRLRCDIRQGRAIAARLAPADGCTLGWTARQLPLPDLQHLADETCDVQRAHTEATGGRT